MNMDRGSKFSIASSVSEIGKPNYCHFHMPLFLKGLYIIVAYVKEATCSYVRFLRLLQTGQLKITGIYCLTALEVLSPRSRCPRATFSVKAREQSILCFFLSPWCCWQSFKFFVLHKYYSLLCPYHHMAFSLCLRIIFPLCMSIVVSPFLIKIYSYWIRTQYDLILS